MRTKLIIDCDIQDAQAILYSASKIIRNADIVRDQERLEELCKPVNPFTTIHKLCKHPEVICPHCNWTGEAIELNIFNGTYKMCPKCNSFINGKEISNAETSEITNAHGAEVKV